MIRDRLYERSPYDDFDPRKYPVDFQGWGSDAPLLGESIQLVRPQRICEVGSWKGRSAINMANAAKALGLHTEIVCVDTWLGSPEHWLRQEPEWYSSLAIRHGMPQLYYTFLANVVRAGVSDVITPFPNTSEGAAAVFPRWTSDSSSPMSMRPMNMSPPSAILPCTTIFWLKRDC